MFCNYFFVFFDEVGLYILNILVMKNFYLLILFVGLVVLMNVYVNNEGEDLIKDFVVGDFDIESINVFVFGFVGILFIGDV